MIAAVPKETYPGETRVALIPKDVAVLKKAGVDVIVESSAGAAALHSDADYEKAGARIEPTREKLFAEADVLLALRGPGADPDYDSTLYASMKKGAAVIAFLEPLDHPNVMQRLAQQGLTLLSMELMPRITRAQSMDALSSMATVSGYHAVLLAARLAPKMFPMMMTAAGTLSPVKVFVLGAGVAGLQAIATARRLGAVVEGYDIRTAVKEQIESLGAKFIEIKVDVETVEGKGGYAAQQSPEYYKRQQELLGEHLGTVDVIITTAVVPGRKAPILITDEMMDQLKPGTVLIDMAAERGGNCSKTQPGETVMHNGAKIVGPLNLPASAPAHASQMYSKNITTFLLHLVKEGSLEIDLEDEITAGTLVTRGGAVVHERVRALLEGE
jgi:NAD(P) transhydrogenase subunit alpha